jgi:hypothetical protein
MSMLKHELAHDPLGAAVIQVVQVMMPSVLVRSVPGAHRE